VPAAKLLTLMLAWPDAFSVAVPKSVKPSLKSTVPDGVPVADVTRAVNVTDCPTVEGLGVPETFVLVTAAVSESTIWVVEPALAAKEEPPM
jgi:hypothetical protein